MRRYMKIQVAAALAGALFLSGCSMLPQEAEEPVINVSAPVVTQRELYEVKRGSVESKLSFNVSFGAARQTPLYFRTSGRLRNLHVQIGARVEAGQLLAELDNTSLPFDVANAEIDLKRKELALADAEAKKGFVGAPGASDLAKLQLDLEASRLSLQYKREQLNNVRLYAPFSGRVLTVAFAEGDQVEAYREVMVIAADGELTARASVDEGTAALLEPGQTVDLYPNDGTPTPVKGKVTQVPPAGTLAASRIVLISLEHPGGRIQLGRNGRAEVILERRENVLLVPLSAIRNFSGRQFVTVVRGESRQEVAIKTGVQSDSFAEVLEGLQAGDRVVSR